MRAVPATEVLLSQADWVRGLATAMARDAASADDLAQEAWAVALEQERPVREPRGWLRTVLQNVARQAARASRRREARERIAACPEAVEGPGTAVERAELHRCLVDRVMALEEPGRTLVLERFFEGLPPRVLARRHGIPVETVRTRLRRALAHLRAAMERDERTGRGAWRALCLPLSPSLAQGAGLVAGIAIMSGTTKILLAGTVVAMLALGTWFGISSSAHDAPAPEPPRAAALAGATSTPPAPGAPGEADREAIGTPRLRGRLEGLHPQVAWTTPLAVQLRDGERTESRRAWPAGDGSFSVDLPPWAATAPFDVEVAADDPAYLPQAWERARATAAGDEWPLPVTCAARLAGEVRGAPRGARLGVAVHPMHEDGPAYESVARVGCGPEGDFELRLRPGDYLLVAAATNASELPVAGVLPGTARAMAVVGEVRHVPPIDLPVGVTLTGRLTLADGTPLAVGLRAQAVGARALSWLRPGLVWWPDGTVGFAEGQGQSDAQGRFTIRDLARKPYAVRFHGASGFFCIEHGDGLPTVVAPADVEFRIDGAILDVELRAAGPLVGPTLEVRDGGRRSTTAVGEAGMRVLLTLGKEYRLVARAGGSLVANATYRVEQPGPQHLPLDLRPDTGPSILLRNVGDDTGQESVGFWFEAKAPARPRSKWVRFERGVARVTDVPAGTVRLTIGNSRFGDQRSYLFMDPCDVEIPATGEVELEVRVRRGGTIRLQASPADRLLAGRWRLFDLAGGEIETGLEVHLPALQATSAPRELPRATSAETERILVPGAYRVEVDVDGQPRRTFDVQVVAGRSATVLVPVD